MDKEKLFNDALVSIIEYAASKGNQLSFEEIRAHFSDLIDDEKSFDFICQYLVSNKITVDGYEQNTRDLSSVEDESEKADIEPESENTSAPDNTESEQELAFIEMYMNDLASISPALADEKEKMITALKNGDETVINRLVELHLHIVAEIAGRYRGRGVSFGDLIQEGNMGLITALSEFNLAAEDFDSFIETSITTAIEDAINVQLNADRVGNRLADKLNQLDNATGRLSEKFGRVPEISELAKEMNITEDEVSWLLKTSLDTLSVNEDTRITDDSSDLSADTAGEKNKDPLTWRVNKS